MPNLNYVALMGNLTRDVEIRVTPKGTSIAQFSLAVNRKRKDDGGQEREEVLYADCEAWGKSGEIIAKYVTKGKPLYVSGRLRLDVWDDKTTHEKKSRMKIVVDQFQFLGDSKGQQDGGHRETPSFMPPPAKPPVDDSDVPF